MCVRYTLHEPEVALAAMARTLAARLALPDWVQPRYNATLTSIMPVVVRGESGPELRGMRWGLTPLRQAPGEPKRLLANAKAETAATLPSFRQGVAQRRCLVPANGFYEWRTAGKTKLPHLFTLNGGEPFAFAGIWEPVPEDPPGTYVILTTEPNTLVAPIHNRMPVILTAETLPRWLGDTPLPAPEYQALTRPLPAERMQVREVSRFMSNSRNEGPQCLAPPEEAEPEFGFS